MTGLHVVVALPAVPAVEGGAAGRHALALLAGLRAHGVRVTAVAARAPQDTAQAPADAEVEDVPVGGARSRLRANLDRVRRPRGELLGTPFAARAHELAADADVLHLEQVEAAWLTRGAPVPAVVHLHHLVRADRDLGPLWSSAAREVAEFAAGERAVARRARAFVVSSPVVAAALHRWSPGASVVTAPLSLVPAHYRPAPLDGPPVAGIIGTGTWVPTARAVERLVTRVWPRVRASVPDATLRVAGRGTAGLPCLRRPPPGVEPVGEVASAVDLLTGLSVLAYPLERGSGMKVKVLEALACGVPVVTTRCGAEGLLSADGVVTAEDDDDLVASVVDLLTDAGARREQGALASAHFARHYAPGPATAPLVELYRQLAGG